MPNTWTDEIFEEMKNEYVTRLNELPEADRPAESLAVVAELATEHGFALNSFRAKLIAAGVYIKKGPAAPAKEGKASTGGTRTSKDAAHAELKAAFTDAGVSEDDIDSDIISKLTGKAASHLADLVRKATK